MLQRDEGALRPLRPDPRRGRACATRSGRRRCARTARRAARSPGRSRPGCCTARCPRSRCGSSARATNALALARFLRERPEVQRRPPSRARGPPATTRSPRGRCATPARSSASRSTAPSARSASSRALELVAEATSFGGVHSTAERRARWGTDEVRRGLHPLLRRLRGRRRPARRRRAGARAEVEGPAAGRAPQVHSERRVRGSGGRLRRSGATSMSRRRSEVWKVRPSAAEQHHAPTTLARPWRELGRPVASSSDVEGSGSGWVVRLCGPVAVRARRTRRDRAPPGRQGRLLLAYLAVNRDRACPRGELIDVLWPEAPPAAADTALSALLSKLRRALGDGRADGALGAAADARRAPSGSTSSTPRRRAPARRGGAAGRRLGARPARRRATRSPRCAGDFLPDCDGPWLHEQRARARRPARARARGAGGRVAARRRAGRGGRRPRARPSRLAPFRESAHRLLMEAHEAAGNPAEALRAFEDLRRLLREELGTAPGPAAMARPRAAAARPRAGPRGRAAPRRARSPPGAGRRRSTPPAGATRSSAARPRRRVLHDGWRARRRRARRGSSCSPARRASARPGSPPSWPATRTPTARSCSTAASTRRRPRPTSRSCRCCAAGRPARRSRRSPSGSARARPSSASCCRSSARRAAGDAGALRGAELRRPAAAPVRRASRRCWPRSRAPRRCSWCSTTCTGPTCRRSS